MSASGVEPYAFWVAAGYAHAVSGSAALARQDGTGKSPRARRTFPKPVSKSRRAPDRARALAMAESHLPLGDWIASCLKRLKQGGRLTLICRADRLDEILAGLGRTAGGAIVFPLWPGLGRPAKRVVVTALKGRRAALTLAPGLVLHQKDGAPGRAAEAILRAGAALDLMTARSKT